MKNINILFIIVLMIGFQSCEDVVNIDLETEEPRLVIEATGIQKENNSLGKFRVKLTETAPYFQDFIPTISDAEISLEIEDEVIEIPELLDNPGVYEQEIPMIYEEKYKLTIKIDEQQYQGETYLYSTVPIDTIEQEEGLFDPDDVLLKIFYTDPEEENYYLFSYQSKHGKELIPIDDEHFNGNQVSTIYNEEFDAGDSIKIRVNGTGRGFNRYISILLDQSNAENNPFATAPTTVRGNIINVSNSEEFPLGYFRISQQFETTYVVE